MRDADTVLVPGYRGLEPPPAAGPRRPACRRRQGRARDVDLHRCLRSRPRRPARRPPRHHALVRRARARPSLSDVEVDPDALYVEDGPILTSAGLSAGIDLCLHLVRSDHGERIGSRVARAMVAAPHRDGRPGAVHRAAAAGAGADGSLERRSPLGPGPPRRAARRRDPRRPRRRQPAHVRPPLRRGDRHDPAEMASRPASPRGPPAARAHRPPGRAGRLRGRLRLGSIAARALPPRHGDNAYGLPAYVRIAGALGPLDHPGAVVDRADPLRLRVVAAQELERGGLIVGARRRRRSRSPC